MKNAALTLLLALAVAFMMGCETGSWQSKMAGSYKGVITNGGDEYDAKTVLKADGDKLSGTYSLDVFGMEHTGKLMDFSVTGERKVKCRWRDDADSEGNLNMTFSPDGSNFKGKWDADNGDGDGNWSGKK